ncbi:hypothetical protein [Synechococcus elongatus]|uniref:hypothetical protein n=1 Tax=Synechococcus elongatus TaxID=32046 RepID=UPI000F7EED6C|nr:hypothetical protein [Synechococcus elongatus]
MERWQKTIAWLKGTTEVISQFLLGTEAFLTQSSVSELSPVWLSFPLPDGLTVPNPNHARERSTPRRERVAASPAIAASASPLAATPQPTASPTQFPTGTPQTTPSSPQPERSPLSLVPDSDRISEGSSLAISRSPLIETQRSPHPTHSFSQERGSEEAFSAAEPDRSHGRSQSKLTVVPKAFPPAASESARPEAPAEVVPDPLQSADRSQAELPPFPASFPTGTPSRSQSARPLPPPPWELQKRLQSPESFPIETPPERSPFPTQSPQGTVGNDPPVPSSDVYPADLSPRTRQVYSLLDQATAQGLQSYAQLMTWVETQSGQRCSRRFIAAWKQLKQVS